MDKVRFLEHLNTKELSFREIFVGSYELMRERLGAYFLLTAMIFLPSNLLVEILMSRLPEEITPELYMRVSLIQGLVSIYSLIALSVTALSVRDQLMGSGKSFMQLLTEGIRSWTRFLLTLVSTLGLVILGLILVVLVSMMIPFLMVPAITAVLIFAVLVVLFIYGSCIEAALHKFVLRENIEFVRLILKDHMGKSIGLMLLFTLISLLLTIPTINTITLGGRMLGQPVAAIILTALVETVLSILNVYVNIGMTLRFMNLESIRTQ